MGLLGDIGDAVYNIFLNPENIEIPKDFFLGCSTSRCGATNSGCTHYIYSGCSGNFSRPWVMCKDHVGTYHCKPHGSLHTASLVVEELKISHALSHMLCKDLCYSDKPVYKIHAKQERNLNWSSSIKHYCSNTENEETTGLVHSWCENIGSDVSPYIQLETNYNADAHHDDNGDTAPDAASPQTFFLGCSTSRCGIDPNSKCIHYNYSGCSGNFSRPWVMCKDETGTHHCHPHESLYNASKHLKVLNASSSNTCASCFRADKAAYKIQGNQERILKWSSSIKHYCSNTEDEDTAGEVHDSCKDIGIDASPDADTLYAPPDAAA